MCFQFEDIRIPIPVRLLLKGKNNCQPGHQGDVKLGYRMTLLSIVGSTVYRSDNCQTVKSTPVSLLGLRVFLTQNQEFLNNNAADAFKQKTPWRPRPWSQPLTQICRSLRSDLPARQRQLYAIFIAYISS
ncbi:hypothetical protein RRG08_057381 [Elysia crispata]|uniref:Uncharacterized protein n=1 Tax=Elysia crispata TaxID=231223 RepID=A0AAE1DQD2_9GAST|nr:hypothetical protein RRG08_057381 [Elysia crispata]